MTTERQVHPIGHQIGARLPRVEDSALLRGQATFVDDLDSTCLEASYVRSPYASAEIGGIDVSQAIDVPGLVAIYTWEDLDPSVGRPLPVSLPHPDLLHPRTPTVLAKDRVHYVGEPVVMVVAQDRYVAEDAAQLIVVDYDPRPVVGSLEAALTGSTVVHAGMDDNLAGVIVQRSGDPTSAIEAADHELCLNLRIERSMASPLEGRAVYAVPTADGGVRLSTSSQVPHAVAGMVAHVLNLPRDAVRVVVPSVGGGFGVKGVRPWPEEVLVPWAALRVGRPVKWTEDRREHFVASAHEREQLQRVRVGFDDDGTILGYVIEVSHDIGAYSQYGLVVSQNTSSHCVGPYAVAHKEVRVSALYSNRVAVAPYRGAGRPEAIFAVERMMDAVAQHRGLDRAEVRRRNMLRPEDLPYGQGFVGQDRQEVRFDSGDYVAALDTAQQMVGWVDFPARQRTARSAGRHLGIGLACYVENSGLGPYEGARAELLASGRIQVTVGTSSQGQGHQTMFSQIAADVMCVTVGEIDVRMGDTGEIAAGVGTYASRTTVVAGSAVRQACVTLARRMTEYAADLFEADPSEVELSDSGVRVVGDPSTTVSLRALAALANPVHGYAAPSAEMAALARRLRHSGRTRPTGGPILSAEEWVYPPSATYPYGVHAAVVEIDPLTAQVTVLQYCVVHDCGRIVNPQIVDGQIHGGVVQGIGGALFERMEYDEHGQLLNASFMDFLMPYATEVPYIEIAHLETLSPHNPLGVKGAGEAGVIPVSAVIASAVEDAEGMAITRMPLSPSDLFALRRSRSVPSP